LDLYDDEYIAPSVKLLIIKILDQTLFFKSGLLWFTGKVLYYKKQLKYFGFFSGQHSDFSSTTHESPYFRLIKKLHIGNEVKSFELILLYFI
jgi:hypothetical protein